MPDRCAAHFGDQRSRIFSIAQRDGHRLTHHRIALGLWLAGERLNASTVGRCHALEGDDRALAGAREAIRGLIDEVSLEPDGDHLRIILKGNLAGLLRLAQENKRPSETDDLLDQIQLVAGARNQHYLQLWRPAA